MTRRYTLILGVLALASAPSLAAEHGGKCEMKQGEASCPMHEGDSKMECPMMDRDGHGAGSMPQGEGDRDMGRDGGGADGDGAMPHGDRQRAMGRMEHDCPMMGHSQAGDEDEARAHGDQGAGDQAAPEDHDAHDGHAPS